MMARKIAGSVVALSLFAAACSSAGVGDPVLTGAPTGAPSGAAAANLDELRVSTFGWETDFSKTNVPLGEIRGGGPPKDGIPSVDQPRFESIEAARGWLADSSPVISLEINGDARAYPLAILIWHEIVNDTVGGVPVVVTFCPLCNTALVFERHLNGSTYDFGTTGNLRHSDLVMYDRQTESWWQQAAGQAIVGELAGTDLELLPAQIVSLADYAEAEPDGEVLSRETGHAKDYGRNPYPGYDDVNTSPFLFEGVMDGRLAPKERVVTIGSDAEALALPYPELAKVGVAEVMLDGEPLVVLWTPGTVSAIGPGTIGEGPDVGATGVFRPLLDGRRLTFRRDGGPEAPIVDLETGSAWSVTGLATGGPLVGEQLPSVAHGDYLWFAWAVFNPETTIWTAD